jgi:acetolactate synthase-1/2/3 large subunit
MKDKFVFMNFLTDQKENVFPMVPNGKGISEMILGSDTNANNASDEMEG